MSDPFGEALRDEYHDQRSDPLYQCDGEQRLTHPLEAFYFGAFETQPGADWIDSQIEGPALDAGAGAGRDTLYFQQQFETVALEISEPLIELLAARGVEQYRQGDLFRLPEQFDRDRFQSVLVAGTQIGLARSIAGLRQLLSDLQTVIAPGGTLVCDAYDPGYESATEMLGFRSDPAPGLGYRVIRYEYGQMVGETLLFQLWSPDRLREATVGTDWTVTDIHRPHDTYYYLARLETEA